MPPFAAAVDRRRQRFARSVLPQAALRAFWLRRRVSVAASKLLRRAPRIERYFAFDDPYSAVALPSMIDLAQRHGVTLAVYPVVTRGIVGDPDLSLRIAASIVDATRLLRRTGATLGHQAPIAPDDVRFVAAWTEAARASGREITFAAEAVAALWNNGAPASQSESLRAIYQRVAGSPPPTERVAFDQAVLRNETSLRSRGHWETPAARIAGEWFFAHERVEQMSALLAELTGKT
jgi:2-hydroxychromene-2-carboxylate isomerase